MLIMPSFKKSLIVEQFQGNYLKDKGSIKITSKWEALGRALFTRSDRLNFEKIRIFHKDLRSLRDAERKLVKKNYRSEFLQSSFILLYTILKKSTEKLWAKSILWAKLDMRILQRLALNIVIHSVSRTVSSA